MRYSNRIIPIIFIVSPLFSLPLILVGMYERRKSAFVYFALFMGLFSYLTFPASDLYRHYLGYLSYKGMGWFDFIDSLPGDILTQLISYLFVNIGIPFEYKRLLTMTVFYSLMLFVFNRVIEESSINYTRKEIFIRLLIWLFFINYYGAVIGVRSGFATAFYLVGSYFLLDRNDKVKAILFFLIAASIHYSMGYFIVASLLLSVFPQKKWMVFLGMIFGIILSEIFIARFEYYFIMHDMATQAGYLGDGIWGTGGADLKSFRGKMFIFLTRCTLYPLIIFWFVDIDKNIRWSKYITGVFFLYVLSFSLGTISSRVVLMLFGISILYIYKVESALKSKIRYINLFLIVSMLSLSTQLFARRDFLRVSDYQMIALPIPFILSHHYSHSEIRMQLNIEDEIRR